MNKVEAKAVRRCITVEEALPLLEKLLPPEERIKFGKILLNRASDWELGERLATELILGVCRLQ